MQVDGVKTLVTFSLNSPQYLVADAPCQSDNCTLADIVLIACNMK